VRASFITEPAHPASDVTASATISIRIACAHQEKTDCITTVRRIVLLYFINSATPADDSRTLSRQMPHRPPQPGPFFMERPMTPNAEFYKPTAEYADKLISQIGQTPSWIAKRIGVTDKRIRYILDGERTVKGETTPIQMTYPEQFALECLAAAAKAKKQTS
jgi:hypothetical protein